MIVTDTKTLSQVSKETTEQEVEKLKLLSRLEKASETAWTGAAGLSAIQIGIPLRFAWFTLDGKDYTLLNPSLLFGIGKNKVKEGCLSIPDKWVDKDRYLEIEYMSHGKKKKAKGFKAQIIRHEIDHMDGKLI